VKIARRHLNYYTRRIKVGNFFAFPGYSDAEWICIFGGRTERSGLGQILDGNHGTRLLDVLCKRHKDPRWLIAVPQILYSIPSFDSARMDKVLDELSMRFTAYERDMVTDDLAAAGGIYPLVKAIRNYPGNTVYIGNSQLEPIKEQVGFKQFVGVASPNLHMLEGGIEDAVARASTAGDETLYVVGAGVSAAIIIDQLYDKFPNSYCFDCGSMWDALVGIGRQRSWRRQLYDNPEALEAWKRKVLTGEQ
jgi:hypothetical protein